MATQPDLSDEQRANLAKLAAYLRTLPAEYPDFEMDDFTSEHGDLAHVPECGTAACAAGHGPVAGVLPRAGETWWQYSERAFAPDAPIDDSDDTAWNWCFSGNWSFIDNTAHGAAARIEWMLEHGVPRNGFVQRNGRAPLSYRTPADAL